MKTSSATFPSLYVAGFGGELFRTSRGFSGLGARLLTAPLAVPAIGHCPEAALTKERGALRWARFMGCRTSWWLWAGMGWGRGWGGVEGSVIGMCVCVCVCVFARLYTHTLSLCLSLSVCLSVSVSLSLPFSVSSVLYVHVVFDDKHVLMCVHARVWLPQI